MTTVTRRHVLKSGTALVGGMAGILATGRPPAFAQGTTVHWLRWTDFVPASDQLLRNEIAKEGEKALGIKLNIETINANDIQARITSAIQSGSGPDIVCVLNNWGQLYGESVIDVSDIAEELGKGQGGFYETSRAVANDGKKWIAVPWCIVGLQIAYRKSWFAEIGYADGKFPQTWEEFREAGKKLKAKGRPFGQTLGHTFGDAPSFWYPYLWSWGGKEVEADGRTVALNSKEVVESVKFAVGWWKDACDEGGLAWDDSSNNRAYLAGTISATINGASIYFVAKRQFPDIAKVTGHGHMPKGPGGRFYNIGGQGRAVMKYSKNQQVAKEFLRWFMDRPQYDKWMAANDGYVVGPTPYWEKHTLWERDPKLVPFKEASKYGRWPGYPGPPSRKASEALVKYILVDMYAQAIKGMKPEDAAKWAEGELKKAYA